MLNRTLNRDLRHRKKPRNPHTSRWFTASTIAAWLTAAIIAIGGVSGAWSPSPSKQPAAPGPRTKPIEQIVVGERVKADNPGGERDLQFGQDVDPATWRKLTARCLKEDGTYADVVLLRPLAWLEEQEAEVGGVIDISVPECGIDGEADVLAIEPCPEIESGRGRIVTGTFKHSSGNVIDLRVESQTDPIGTTGNHPFWSEDRQDFVRADSLAPGERLRTLTGITRVVSLSPRGDPEAVYNLEVQVDHVYHVTGSGILVHNGGACAGGKKYVTYTADDLENPGKLYVGRTSGYGSVDDILKKRQSNHHRTLGQLKQDQVHTSYAAIRGREQMLMDSFGSRSSNTIRGISLFNPNRKKYLRAAKMNFGDL